MPPTNQEKHLLREYARPIVHMRRQLCLKRLGLVLGAGVSTSFKLPTWVQLVDKVANDPRIRGKDILNRFTARASLAFKTELLFQHFRKLESRAPLWKSATLPSMEFENRTVAKWQQICAKHLYEKAPLDFPKALKDHPYFSNLVPLVQSTPLTITYNFDDFLERALCESRVATDKSRGFETVVNPWSQFRREHSVVYHPNGVIKSELMELPVDRFVFSESSFARQAIGTSGDGTFLLNHFCKNTCLLIGSSLEDDTLRTALIQSAATNPGSFHYCVHFLDGKVRMRAEDAEAIRKANFNVFNLITLFLNESEIAALCKLIDPQQVDDDCLSDIAAQVDVPLAYRFYLTGALGVGKSTTARHLQNLTVLDEWVEPRPAILAKPWDTLTLAEKTQADEWIANQFCLKNDTLRREKIGIFLVDRPPLDPLVFTAPLDRHKKAQNLLSVICPNDKWTVSDGAVCILQGEPMELSVRVMATGRDKYTAEKLQIMQDAMLALYKGQGAFPLDTRGMSVAEVTKRVAELIFFEEYIEFKLHKRLRRF